MLVVFSLHLVCGNIWISKVSHKLDSVFQQVFQPFDLLELFLFFLPALQKVVAGLGLGFFTFAFFASKQGRDQVHPLAMPLSIPYSLSHSPQGVHSLHLQSMGQGSWWQASSSSVLPSHCSPPLTASFSTPLFLVETPPPQVALHSPQLLHSSQTHGPC